MKMFERTKKYIECSEKYIKDRGRKIIAYTALSIGLIASNSGCAWYMQSMKDFHTKPLETIRDDPLGAAAAIGTDIGIAFLIAEASSGGGGGGGGPVVGEGPGETPEDPD